MRLILIVFLFFSFRLVAQDCSSVCVDNRICNSDTLRFCNCSGVSNNFFSVFREGYVDIQYPGYILDLGIGGDWINLAVSIVGPYDFSDSCQKLSQNIDIMNMTNFQYQYGLDGVPYSSTINFGNGIGRYYVLISGYGYTESDICPFVALDFNTDLYCDTVPACDSLESCTSMSLSLGERYWLSAWVKEDHATQVLDYASYVELNFTGVNSSVSFTPTGEIIDGWQRIVGDFIVPMGTTNLQIDLVNASGVDAYFDDIRVHPWNAGMKSYVYDPETFWLVAELDDNNYATFYEYDKEGGLVRIKKETSRGVMTIQETRSYTQTGLD